MAKVMSEQEYLGQKGVGSPISDYMMDKTVVRKPAYSQHYDARSRNSLRKAQDSYQAKRDQARREYRRLISTGKLRAPTKMEEMQRIAKGNPENKSVQAAKRVLAKMKARQKAVKGRSGSKGG